MSEVHIYARHIKRAFTFEEWGDYLEEHPDDANEVVFSEDGFDWNIHCVCCNPERVLDVECGNLRFSVKVAKAAGRWVVGYEYTLRESGGSSAACYVGPNTDDYLTKREAILHEIKRMLKRIDDEIRNVKRRGGNVANVLRFKVLMTEELGKLTQVQLSLF